ncbi:MAG: hypothetical protein LBN71_02805, partial [Tannerella sp.]|nr:hypothetical protein [Tannerella sp.]
MKKRFFKWTLAIALVSLGFVACKDDKNDVIPDVNVTIQVEFPGTYQGVTITNPSLEGIEIAYGSNLKVTTDASGKATVSLAPASYQFTSTVLRLFEAENGNANGNWAVNFLGTKSATISKESASVTLTLNGTGTPQFTPYGDILVANNVINLDDADLSAGYDIRSLFQASLKEGDTRATSFTFEIVGQPKKKETGGTATGAEVAIGNIYSLKEDGYTLVASDSLPPAFENNGLKREIVPATIRATLKAGGTFISSKEFPLVWTEGYKDLISIEISEDNTMTGLQTRFISGTTTFTVGLPYTAGTGTTGFGITKSGTWKGTYSDGSVNTNMADKSLYEEKDHLPQPGDADYHEGGYISGGYYFWTERAITLTAENANGSPIAAPSDGGTPASDNTGMPISAYRTSAGRVNAEQFYVGDPANNPTAGAIGYIYVFPYGTSKDDFRALKFTAKTANVTGIEPSPAQFFESTSVVRKIYQGGILPSGSAQATPLQAAFYAYLKVSEGPSRPFSSSAGAEGDLDYMQVVAGSWNKYEGEDIIEPGLGTAALRNNSLRHANAAATSTDPADYDGFHSIQLSAKGKTAPAGTT